MMDATSCKTHVDGEHVGSVGDPFTIVHLKFDGHGLFLVIGQSSVFAKIVDGRRQETQDFLGTESSANFDETLDP